MASVSTIKLGSENITKILFSYPNDGHEADSLETTIKHYLNDSLSREHVGDFNINVRTQQGDYLIDVTCETSAIAESIRQRYQKFFDIGKLGFTAAKDFQATGSWKPDWKFLLPLGLPMEFAKALEVMDFPPLSLIQKQDYLNSKTTNRWWELLILNGVPEPEKAQYTCILDIVPVAAPANDGRSLDTSGIYEGPFDSYTNPLLDLFSTSTSGQARRPLIALGLPIRKWIQRIWGKNLEILDVDSLDIESGGKCSVLASNHPSFFFYAVNSYSGTPDAERRNLAAGLAVMKQDVVAAAWHSQMGKTPDADPSETLENSKQKWQGRDAELMALVRQQAGLPPFAPLEAIALEEEAKSLKDYEPSKEELAALERKFFDADRSPQPRNKDQTFRE